MRDFRQSDIFTAMNNGNAIMTQLAIAVRSIDAKYILNDKLKEPIENMNKAYRDTLTTKVIEAIRSNRLILISMPIDRQFPSSVPYFKVKKHGQDVVIVDLTKFAVTQRSDTGAVESVKIDIGKLYGMATPAYIALEVLNEHTAIPSGIMKDMAYIWAKLFNRILTSQKIFIGSKERYEAFMYYAAKFFLIYYMQAPLPVVDNISSSIINGIESQYLVTIENRLKHKKIDLYHDWTTFAKTMFSDEITNIKSAATAGMTVEQFLRLYATYMGRDAIIALWSADYFFWVIFNAFNHTWIVNDRAFQSIVDEEPKVMSSMLRGIYKEI